MSDKKPTPKQVRFHYNKIATLRSRLAHALNDAHDAGVLQYEKYTEESPCCTLVDTWERIKKTNEKQLAQAMREEIRKSRGRWE